MGWREKFGIATKAGESAVTSLKVAASLVGASVAKSASDFASDILPNVAPGGGGSPKQSVSVQSDLQPSSSGFSTNLLCKNVSGVTNGLLLAIKNEIERQVEASKTASAKSTEVLCSFFNVFIDDFFQDRSNPRRKAAEILKEFFSDSKSLYNPDRKNIIDMGLNIMEHGEDEGNTIDWLLGKMYPVSDKSAEGCPAPILQQEEPPKASFSKIAERLEREDKTKANPAKPQHVQVEESVVPLASLAVASQGNQDNPTIQNAFGSTRQLSPDVVDEGGLVATEPIVEDVELDAKKETQQVLGGEQRQEGVAQEDEGRQAEEWEAELVLREISQILEDKKSEFEQYRKHLMEEAINELDNTKNESLKTFARKLSREIESKNEAAIDDDTTIEGGKENIAASVHVLVRACPIY